MSDPRPGIAFDNEHVEPILDGEKTVTIRHDFEGDFDPLDGVDLLDRQGIPFATARVTTQFELRADWVSYADFTGHQRYDTTAELLEDLREYYPGVNLESEDVLDVIAFQVEDGGGDE